MLFVTSEFWTSYTLHVFIKHLLLLHWTYGGLHIQVQGPRTKQRLIIPPWQTEGFNEFRERYTDIKTLLTKCYLRWPMPVLPLPVLPSQRVRHGDSLRKELRSHPRCLKHHLQVNKRSGDSVHTHSGEIELKAAFLFLTGGKKMNLCNWYKDALKGRLFTQTTVILTIDKELSLSLRHCCGLVLIWLGFI